MLRVNCSTCRWGEVSRCDHGIPHTQLSKTLYTIPGMCCPRYHLTGMCCPPFYLTGMCCPRYNTWNVWYPRWNVEEMLLYCREKQLVKCGHYIVFQTDCVRGQSRSSWWLLKCIDAWSVFTCTLWINFIGVFASLAQGSHISFISSLKVSTSL